MKLLKYLCVALIYASMSSGYVAGQSFPVEKCVEIADRGIRALRDDLLKCGFSKDAIDRAEEAIVNHPESIKHKGRITNCNDPINENFNTVREGMDECLRIYYCGVQLHKCSKSLARSYGYCTKDIHTECLMKYQIFSN